MTMYGADLEALETLAQRFEVHKETMIGLVHQVTGDIEAVIWEGPDAEQLRPDWNERLVRLITLIDDTLGSIGVEAAQQAAEQRAASEV